MITFKQFLSEEVMASKRKSLVHLQQMKPLEFLEWAKGIHSNTGGVLKDLGVTLKVDGLGARFGKSNDGQFFFEGSRTGPIFHEKAFSAHAKSKGSKDEVVKRAAHYDDMFDLLKSAAVTKAVPNGAKVVCEIFYNPIGTHTAGSSVFVSIKYDTAKLGKIMTIVPITVLDATTGEEHSDRAAIMKKLYSASNNDVKIVDPLLKSKSIDIKAQIKDVVKYGDKEIELLNSRKAVDKPAKEALINALQDAKDELAQYLLDHPGIEGKEILGKDLEGLVMNVNGSPVKVTTQDFKDKKRAEREAHKS